MNILVTAGNTQTPIDKVRCITNIFTGRTGGKIAVEAWRRGHHVTHFTSHPEVVAELAGDQPLPTERWRVESYQTFDDLASLMQSFIPKGGFDAIIHAAAISDYALSGVYAPTGEQTGHGVPGLQQSGLKEVSAGKVKSHYPELWLKLVPTPKLVDRIRRDWGFRGMLMKFKLEVGVSAAELLQIAERSRVQSAADFMVANTLEGRHDWALIGPVAGRYQRVSRAELADCALDLIEKKGA